MAPPIDATAHSCRCCAVVERLSFLSSAGRLHSHANLNDVVKLAVIPSWLVPVGLDREDGRRPDGVTVFPYSRGRALCWDATRIDTFSQASLIASASEQGAAEARKRQKYRGLMDRYSFEPLAVETTGVLGTSGTNFVRGLAHRMREVTGDRRESKWLFERQHLKIKKYARRVIIKKGAQREHLLNMLCPLDSPLILLGALRHSLQSLTYPSNCNKYIFYILANIGYVVLMLIRLTI